MFNSALLDTIVGLLVVLIAFSSLISLLVEYVNNWDLRQRRQMYLYLSLRKALNDPSGLSWGTLIYKHPLISSAKVTHLRYPAYLASSTFADALIAVVREQRQIDLMIASDNRTRLVLRPEIKEAKDTDEFELVVSSIINLRDTGDFKRLMLSFLEVTEETDAARLKAVKAKIAAWFDNYQDRVIGEYKKTIRHDLKWFGVVFALIFNINFLSIGTKIASDEKLRSSLISKAEEIVSDSIAINPLRFECKSCTSEQIEEKYHKYITKELELADTESRWFITSGVPLGWSIPKSAKQIRIEYFRSEIELLKKQKKDTIKHLLGRYCLVQALLNPDAKVFPWLHNLNTRMITADTINHQLLDSLLKKNPGMDTLNFMKNIRYFFAAIKDSLTIGKCLPDLVRSRYNKCIEECGDLDRMLFQADVIRTIDDRIGANELEISLYDQVYIGEIRSYSPWSILKHNLRRWEDVAYWILGAFVMGWLGGAGAETWFQLLLRLFEIRNAGTRPQKRE